MHGMVHAEFRHHAMERVGHARWTALLVGAGLPAEPPRLSIRYPDEHLIAAVGLLAEATGTDGETVLVEFGQALFPSLVRTYGDLIPPTWGPLDLIEHTEGVIHRAVRLQDANTAPARLTATRTSEDEVRVLYSSPRQLCSLARGLLVGAGLHFGDALSVSEEECVRRGGTYCEFLVTTA